MSSNKAVCIIGAGASGSLCAYFLLKKGIDVTLFDTKAPLLTLLPTGGGRCNLAHAEYDFKELAKNYPRGEKFLYSVFSQFSTYDTIALFEEIGIKTYTQDDGRIFPESNSAKDVRNKILHNIKKSNFVKEKIISVEPKNDGYKVKSENAEYFFSEVIIAIGGGNKAFGIKGLNIEIIPFAPALVGLNSDINNLSGIVLKNVYSKDCKIFGDILFTHYGISGPLAYKISSIKAYDKFPYKLCFDLYQESFDLQEMLNKNPHKNVKNILAEILPHKFCEYILGDLQDRKAFSIDGKTRDLILNKIHNFEALFLSPIKNRANIYLDKYLEIIFGKKYKTNRGMLPVWRHPFLHSHSFL